MTRTQLATSTRGRARRRTATPAARAALRGRREVLLVAAGLLTYFGVRAATAVRSTAAIDHADALFHVERVLGIAREDDLQRLVIGHQVPVTLANWVYIWGHWPVIALVAVWLFRRHPDDYRLLRTAMEADVHLWAGRLEVRHLKRAGPLPLLWDRWALAGPWSRFATADELLAAPPSVPLMLDLKGSDPAAALELDRALARTPTLRGVLVSARSWPLLARIDAGRARRMTSAGRRWQLSALETELAAGDLDGAVVHRRLLDAERVRRLHRLVPAVFTWPVTGEADAEHARALGVDGLIIDDPGLIAHLRRARERG